MGLKIYNTLSRRKEPFETLQPGRVAMYVCGPTVYDRAHVGHAMSVLVFDVIRRYLEYRGYQVLHVMNYTDVDDKIIHRANQEGVNAIELAEKYIRDFDRHLEDLNILRPNICPRATQEIPTILDMVKGLEDRGYAYEVNGDVYFRVGRVADYGKLSRRQLADMQAGARVKVDERKEHPMDFALWKSSKPDEPAWESPWGKGRPGWHIECSAMNFRHLGPQIDIHGGGNDLIFPHHENEIAQSESLTGKPFAQYWVHNGMMQLSGEKMSKSLGNLITIEEFLAHYPADVLRLMVLNANYRRPITYADETVDQAKNALSRLRSGLRPSRTDAQGAPESVLAKLDTQKNVAEEGFKVQMDDDFNTAGALGQLFDLVRVINQARDSGATQNALQAPQEMLRKLAGVLGLCLDEDFEPSAEIAPFVDLLIEVRSMLRDHRQWDLADQIRDRLEEMGVSLEDQREGTIWRWK